MLTLKRRSVEKKEIHEEEPEVVTAVQWGRISTAIELNFHETERLLEWYEVAKACLGDAERAKLNEEYPDSFPAEWREWNYESTDGNTATTGEVSCEEYLDAAVSFVDAHFNPANDHKNDPLSNHRETYTLFYVGCEWFKENDKFDRNKPEHPVKNPRGTVERCDACQRKRVCEDLLSFEEDNLPPLQHRIEINAKPVVMHLFRITAVLLNWVKNNEAIQKETENLLQDELEVQVKTMFENYNKHELLPKHLLGEPDFFGLQKYLI